MQEDGNLVMISSVSIGSAWATHTTGHPGAILMLRDDGNAVVVDTTGNVLWQTNTAWNAQLATPTPAPSATPAPPQLAANQQLSVGQALTAANGKSRLSLQTDGNLVLYRLDTGAAIWASNSSGKPATHVLMQPDGNFVLYNSNNSIAYWSSRTFGHSGAKLILRDDGNLVVVDPTGAQLWASNTAWNAAAPTPAATPNASLLHPESCAWGSIKD